MSFQFAGPAPSPAPGWSVRAPNFSPVYGPPTTVPPPSSSQPSEPNFSPVDGGSTYVPPPSSGGRRRRSTPAPMTPAPVEPPEPAPEPDRSFRAPRQYDTTFPVYGPVEKRELVLRPAPEMKGLDRVAQSLRGQAQQRGDTLSGNILGFGAGFVQAGSDTGRFAKQLVTRPVGTLRDTASGLWTLATDREARETVRSDVSYRLKAEPGVAFGGLGFDLIPITLPSGVSKAQKAKALARSPTPAPSQTPIGRGVTIGADTVVDFDFFNPADRRVVGAQTTRPSGGVVTELSVADRTYRIADSQPTRLVSFDDAGRATTELLFDRRVETFDRRGRLVSSADSIQTQPAPRTIMDTSIDRQIVWTAQSDVDRRSAAFATSTAQTRFTAEADGLFVRGAQATRQDTLTLANYREVAARLEDAGLVSEVRSVTPPQFTFSRVREPADRIILARDGDVRFSGQIAQSRAWTEGAVSTRGDFDVFTQRPPVESRPFDFSGLQPPADPLPVPPQSMSLVSPTTTSGGLSSPSVIPKAMGSIPDTPRVSIRDVPEFSAATSSVPVVRGFEGVSGPAPASNLGLAGSLTFAPTPGSAVEFESWTSTREPQSQSVFRVSEPSVTPSVGVESVSGPSTVFWPGLSSDVSEAAKTAPATSPRTVGGSRVGLFSSNRPLQEFRSVQPPPGQVSQLRIGTPGFRASRTSWTPPPPVPVVVPLFAPIPRAQQAFAPGFRVFVRERGEFRPQGPVLTRAEALEFGAYRVDATPAASFKIKPVSTSPTGTFGGRGFFGFFEKSKREPGVFVEPARRRIRTPGELRGITFKGIQSQRLTTRRVFR